MMSDPSEPELTLRRNALGVMARAAPDALAARWSEYTANSGGEPEFVRLRGPEVGLTMIRGRMGGTGRPFNLGEATITRCTLRTGEGRVGTAYVLGRGKRHAEIAALVDALLQDPDRREAVRAAIVEPLATHQAQAVRRKAAETAATRVEFFTLVRGED